MTTLSQSHRVALVFLGMMALLLIFAGRAFVLQIVHRDRFLSAAQKQHQRWITIDPERGDILDRHRRPLAIDVAGYSLYAEPRYMTEEDKQNAWEVLVDVLGQSKEYWERMLSQDKGFVWLRRKLPLDVYQRLQKRIPAGLGFIKEGRRVYPHHYLASHVIGFAGLDNIGLEGLEKYYDSWLKGQQGLRHAVRDAKGRLLVMDDHEKPAQDGANLVLTIDETLQFFAEYALDWGMETFQARAASLVAMDPRTGEILALANRPHYDLDNFSQAPPETRINRAVALVYEPGSVFKIVTAAAALEEGIADEDDEFFCENGAYRVGPHVLHDHVPHGRLTFRQVFEQSSNICTVKIVQRLGSERFLSYARRFGFGRKTGVDLIGEVPGVLKPVSQWSKTSVAAVPIGHEVTVTPIQIAAAFSAVANGGRLMRPFVVKYIIDDKGQILRSFQPQVVEQVISSRTADRLKDILVGVVENGTGKRARLDGVRVAGKTGTAQKIVDGRYSHTSFYASFIGFLPAESPRLTVAVVFDDPKTTHYGGTVAAPVFRLFVQKAWPYLKAKDTMAPMEGQLVASQERGLP